MGGVFAVACLSPLGHNQGLSGSSSSNLCVLPLAEAPARIEDKINKIQGERHTVKADVIFSYLF